MRQGGRDGHGGPGMRVREGEIVERFVGSRTTVFDDMRELPGLPAAVTH
ncbi:hypothetical protein EES42_33030 [Streptomyces sp. ADI95-17]|nr:hypothetical protein EES42_33030 [Streptomyces sp. ADI95-17]